MMFFSFRMFITWEEPNILSCDKISFFSKTFCSCKVTQDSLFFSACTLSPIHTKGTFKSPARNIPLPTHRVTTHRCTSLWFILVTACQNNSFTLNYIIFPYPTFKHTAPMFHKSTDNHTILPVAEVWTTLFSSLLPLSSPLISNTSGNAVTLPSK